MKLTYLLLLLFLFLWILVSFGSLKSQVDIPGLVELVPYTGNLILPTLERTFVLRKSFTSTIFVVGKFSLLMRPFLQFHIPIL